MSGTMTMMLFRPVGPAELELLCHFDFRAFPPRLPQQPIFYPALGQQYAIKVTRDWNVKASGAGIVTPFQVRSSFVAAYEVQPVGGSAHTLSAPVSEATTALRKDIPIQADAFLAALLLDRAGTIGASKDGSTCS